MSGAVLLMAAAAFLLGGVFCAGLVWMSRHRGRAGKTTTSKAVVWFCLVNGVAWVWSSYVLAYLGREQIAQELSRVALTEIVAVVLIYCIKSLFEKRPGFGAVGSAAIGAQWPRDNERGEEHGAD